MTLKKDHANNRRLQIEYSIRDMLVKSKILFAENDFHADLKLVDDLKADSLTVVEIVMQLEEEFNIEIPDEDAQNMTTIAHMVDYIVKKTDN